eukprot:3320005-Amphidinium_carterae.1
MSCHAQYDKHGLYKHVRPIGNRFLDSSGWGYVRFELCEYRAIRKDKADGWFCVFPEYTSEITRDETSLFGRTRPHCTAIGHRSLKSLSLH